MYSSKILNIIIIIIIIIVIFKATPLKGYKVQGGGCNPPKRKICEGCQSHKE